MPTFSRFVVLFTAALFPLAATAVESSSAPTLSEASAKLSTMQVPFVPNGGQWDKQAAFAAHTFAGTLFVTTEGKLVYSLPGKSKLKPKADASGHADKHARKAAAERTPGWVLTETFINADHKPLAAKPAGYLPAQAKASYLIGAASRHTKPLDSFERLRLGEVFKGVEVELRATGSNVEKIFTVQPHQDPNTIRLQLSGAKKLALGKTGELIAYTGNGPVTYTAPIAYQQDASGKRSEIKVAYALNAATKSYGFSVSDYNPDQALVIDPLLQSTYLGGAGDDLVSALAIHPSGDVYVAGLTTSTTFPKTLGGAQPAYATTVDAFVSRFNASLTVLMQSTYLGGTGIDGAAALAIHPISGDVYVAGSTESTNFPATAGAAQTANAGRDSGSPITYSTSDAFVSRFNASLTVLVQSTYLGGTGVFGDSAGALAIHPVSGEVYVAGETGSISNFPGTVGGARATYAGIGDAFVSRFNANLTALAQSTYLGGTGRDVAHALAIHPTSGEVYVVGDTESTDFPGISGGAYAGLGDAFASRFNANLTALAQSTYLGGIGTDVAYALAIHSTSGEVYVAGVTASITFPGTTGGAQPAHASGSFPDDAFVSRFNANLTMLAQSTYLGGVGGDAALALAIHPASGEVYVAGSTGSPTFPGTAGGAQAACALFICTDVFISRFNANLKTLAQSTYLGGSGKEGAFALAIHPASREVYVAGATGSTNFPTTSGGAQAVSGGGPSLTDPDEAFITRISRSLALVDIPGATIPGVPVIGTASAGDRLAVVSFTAPASNGGATINGYTVTSSPGGMTAIGAASPITVPGLTNGTAYTFTVTASNAVGMSAASAASNSVTPAAGQTPTSNPPPAPAPSGGGGGGGSLPLLLLLALCMVYGLRRRSFARRAGVRV